MSRIESLDPVGDRLQPRQQLRRAER